MPTIFTKTRVVFILILIIKLNVYFCLKKTDIRFCLPDPLDFCAYIFDIVCAYIFDIVYKYFVFGISEQFF